MNIMSFLLYCVVVTFTPGPSNIVILATVNQNGFKHALKFIAGSSLAFVLLIAASVTVNRELLTRMPVLLAGLRIVGSLFILYLAYKILRMDVSRSAAKQATSFMSGFCMQFLNPKVVLFTFTVIPIYVMPYYTSGFVLSAFVALVSLIGILAYLTWAVFGKLLKTLLQKYQKATNIILASSLVYSAVMVSGIVELAKG
jgi:threonine/homoserine/homoserine lactone efflux protein